ncbi:MAG TPA: copper amine oxidase N-terminal domain-containing protein [Clostridia bacterium]
MKNFHGNEIKLLTDIYLYPEKSSDMRGGDYSIEYSKNNGKYSVEGSRYINIYDCDVQNTINKIAHTISHEYGHHFTYYYLIKSENKVFDDTDTLYQSIRGLKGNTSINSGPHKWSLAEIAAEDYVQYFGSPTAKTSIQFYDITNFSAKKSELENQYGSFNINPQENAEILTACNVPEAREYWLKAFGYSGQKMPDLPSPSYLYIDSVNNIDGTPFGKRDNLCGITLRWSPHKDPYNAYEYTLVAFISSMDLIPVPVKTVYSGNETSAVVGYYKNGNSLYTDGLFDQESKKIKFLLYTKDNNGYIVCSNFLSVDTTTISQSAKYETIRSSGSSMVSVLYQNSFVDFTDVSPVVLGGRTMVPLRKIFERLGAGVNWDASSGTINAVIGSTKIELKVGSKTAYRNGEPMQLDTSPVIINNRTLVPLRFIAESFGKKVSWDGIEKVAIIN